MNNSELKKLSRIVDKAWDVYKAMDEIDERVAGSAWDFVNRKYIDECGFKPDSYVFLEKERINDE